MAKAWNGTNQVISELRKFGKDVESKINKETEGIAFQIELDAKEAAPKNFGKLAQSISTSQPMTDRGKAIQSRVITVNEMYGAYMEFGTGKKVSVPAEFTEMANEFRGSTGRSFEDGVRSIEQWLKAKGGDPSEAKWVLLKILGAGLNPRPFLYPSWVKGKADYLNNLKQMLKQLNKKI